MAIDPNSDERQTDLVDYITRRELELVQLEQRKAEARAAEPELAGNRPQLRRASGSQASASAGVEQSGSSAEITLAPKLAKCGAVEQLESA